jgi:hypothetical protein
VQGEVCLGGRGSVRVDEHPPERFARVARCLGEYGRDVRGPQVAEEGTERVARLGGVANRRRGAQVEHVTPERPEPPHDVPGRVPEVHP